MIFNIRFYRGHVITFDIILFHDNNSCLSPYTEVIVIHNNIKYL